MDLDLKGKSVVVTGGGSNIGRAIVLAFAGEGAHITIGDIDTVQAGKTAEFAQKLGAASAQVVKTDVTNLEQVQLTDMTLSGLDGTVLEYTGTNTDATGADRHSVFALADAGDGTTFGVFVSGDAETWDLSREVYDEAVASFQTG